MSTPFNRDLKPIIVTKQTKIQLKVKQTNFDKIRNIKFATETPMPKDTAPLLDALYDSTTLEDMKRSFEKESENLNENGTCDWFGMILFCVLILCCFLAVTFVLWMSDYNVWQLMKNRIVED